MTDQEIEREIVAKGLTAPRITPEHLDRQIAAEYFFTLDKATEGSPQMPGLSTFTMAVLVLKNGFIVTGESAPASPENFDAKLGRKIAWQKARDKIWALEGYQLRTALHEGRGADVLGRQA